MEIKCPTTIEVLSEKAKENDLVTILISMIIPNTHTHTVR